MQLPATLIEREGAIPAGPRRLRRPAAAEYLGVTESFLEKAAVTGYGPPMLRLSRRLVIYDTRDLDDWLASRRVLSSAGAVASAA